MSGEQFLPGICWPAITRRDRHPLADLHQQLCHWEYADAAQLRAGQAQQLEALGRHLGQHCDFHRRRLLSAGIAPDQPLTLARLRQLPPLTRRHVQAAGPDLFSQFVPPSHLPLGETRTSGSSGEPVVVRRTQVNQLFWLASTLRGHHWWRSHASDCLAVVRANLPQPHIRQDNWGAPLNLLYATGPLHGFSMSLDTATLAAELSAAAPQYLLIYPTALRDLLRHFRQHGGALPSLKQIRTLGETLSDDLRHEAGAFFAVELFDSYSSQELGVIALQCPVSGLYHVMAEHVLVEVLDADGQPCGPGECGEVVVTDLHNFATPLIRYAIGDHAEVGPVCPCARSLPTLRRILGRSRNMLLYPDGSRRWPRVGFDRYREVAPVQQYQLIQHSREQLEVRLVVERPLQPCEQRALGEIIKQALGHPFALDFRYFAERLPLGPGGKFEEFVSLCAD